MWCLRFLSEDWVIAQIWANVMFVRWDFVMMEKHGLALLILFSSHIDFFLVLSGSKTRYILSYIWYRYVYFR